MARYDPFEEMDRMFEQLRTRTWTPDVFGRTDFGAPALGGINMDLKKHGDSYVFVADLPGFETEEIDLTFAGDTLVLSAESSLHEETMGDETAGDGTMEEMASDGMASGELTSDGLTRDETMDEKTTSETMAGDETTADADEIAVRREFTRSRRVSERVTIPEEIAEDEITATYRNGVLEVHLPLVGSEADDGRKIDIAD